MCQIQAQNLEMPLSYFSTLNPWISCFSVWGKPFNHWRQCADRSLGWLCCLCNTLSFSLIFTPASCTFLFQNQSTWWWIVLSWIRNSCLNESLMFTHVSVCFCQLYICTIFFTVSSAYHSLAHHSSFSFATCCMHVCMFWNLSLFTRSIVELCISWKWTVNV